MWLGLAGKFERVIEIVSGGVQELSVRMGSIMEQVGRGHSEDMTSCSECCYSLYRELLLELYILDF